MRGSAPRPPAPGQVQGSQARPSRPWRARPSPQRATARRGPHVAYPISLSAKKRFKKPKKRQGGDFDFPSLHPPPTDSQGAAAPYEITPEDGRLWGPRRAVARWGEGRAHLGVKGELVSPELALVREDVGWNPTRAWGCSPQALWGLPRGRPPACGAGGLPRRGTSKGANEIRRLL